MKHIVEMHTEPAGPSSAGVTHSAADLITEAGRRERHTVRR